jgi:hypothetical protein
MLIETMRVAKNYSFLILLLFLLVASYFYFSSVHASYRQITSFQACVDAGFTVLPTYPETCKVPGKTFTNELQLEQIAKENEVKVPTITKEYTGLTYFLDGQEIQFFEGKSSRIGTSTDAGSFVIVGTPFIFNNNEEKKQVAFLVEKRGSTKNIKYYLSSAVALNTGYAGLNMMPLDSNISSSTLSYASGTLLVVYTTSQVSQQKKQFTFENALLKEITH